MQYKFLHSVHFIMDNSASFSKLIYLIILITAIQITAQNIKFEQISADQNLSQSIINCILQDKRSFLWFGTGLGLKRFDGNKFKTYQHNPESNSLQKLTVLFKILNRVYSVLAE